MLGCDGEEGIGQKNERKDSSTRSLMRKSGNPAEVVAAGGVEQEPGFLNPGCAIQEDWKTRVRCMHAGPSFPRLPQARI